MEITEDGLIIESIHFVYVCLCVCLYESVFVCPKRVNIPHVILKSQCSLYQNSLKLGVFDRKLEGRHSICYCHFNGN